ncbi:MAG: DUF6249 domain-containing protein [Pseudomonadota bacterium]
MSEGQMALLVPFGFFILVGVWIWLYLRGQGQQQAEFQQTVRLALEKGHELSPELIEMLMQPAQDRDLRRGLIAIGLAVGFAALAFMVPHAHATMPMLGIAALPFFVGVAYLILHVVGQRQKKDDQSSVT